jgi:hypothetical protein
MTPGSIRRHQAVYRGIVAVTPQSHRARHGKSQVTLFGDLLATGETPMRLWIRVLPDLLGVFAAHRQEVAYHVIRASLALAGMAPIAIGVVMGSIWLDEYGDVSVLFPATAAGLVLQGGLGLLWLMRRLERWRPISDQLFVVTEMAALAIGGIVLGTAILTRTPANPETLRMMVGTAAMAHAALGLTALRLTRRRTTESSMPD